MKGKLIAIEGLDGSGKATQSDLLYQALKAKTPKVKKISFPDYGSDSSAPVRMYLNGELGCQPDEVNAYAASSFYAIDRYVSYKKDWGKFLESGGTVIADRYTTSNAIHQCSKLPEEQWDGFLEWLFNYEYNLLGLPEPSLTIYLRVDPEISQGLLINQYEGDEGKRDIHERDEEYLNRSQTSAEYCAEKFGWKIIECCCDGKMKNIEEIHELILKTIEGTEARK